MNRDSRRSKLEGIISGHHVNADDAAWLRGVFSPLEEELRANEDCVHHYEGALRSVVEQYAEQVQGLIKVGTGEIKHLRDGLCPDELEGHDARDPDCPACQVLMRAMGFLDGSQKPTALLEESILHPGECRHD